MLHDLVSRISLFSLLRRIDEDLASAVKAQRCPQCGARLDYARYRRKPRGGPDDIPEQCCVRLSLCCSREGCRGRRLPPSTLFFGRRVYWSVVVLVLVTLRQQRVEGHSAASLCRQFGVDRSTLRRWLVYFREEFPSTPWWQRLRGQVSARVRNDHLPGQLLLHFIGVHGDAEDGMVACVKFLAIGFTAGSEHAP
jgi:hypothetical protein